MVLCVKNGLSHFDEPLLDYVRKGHIKVLQSFFQQDNSRTTDFTGSTLLHYAAESNNVSMTQHFIDIEYNLDSIDHNGNTPLMLAVKRGSIDTAKLLIKADANIYLRNFEGKSILPDRSQFKLKPNAQFVEYVDLEPLKKYRELTKSILEKLRKNYWNDEQLLLLSLAEINCSLINVICLRDANVTRLMLENGYSANDSDVVTKMTALHEAVILGDYQNVKVLLEYGADIHALNNDGISAIYSYNGPFAEDHSDDVGIRLPILKMLIEHGALLTRPPEKSTPAQFIMSSGKLWALKTLMQYDFEWDPFESLQTLVSNSDPDALEAARGKKLDLNSSPDPNKSPVLSLASMLGRLKKVQFLLEAGADPNINGEFGYTPFSGPFRYFLELEKDHLPIVRLMLQYGADAQFEHQDGTTVFDLATRQQHTTLLEPVIDHLALIESLDQPITHLIRSKINSQDTFKVRFEICKRRLGRMKNMVVHENVTLYKLLTEDLSKIIRYTRRPDFAEKFQQEMKIRQLFFDILPYYSISIRKRVGKAINLTKLRKQAVILLNKIIGYPIKDYHEMLSKIVDYLNSDDLKSICKVSDLDDLESLNLDMLFSVVC